MKKSDQKIARVAKGFYWASLWLFVLYIILIFLTGEGTGSEVFLYFTLFPCLAIGLCCSLVNRFFKNK